MSLEKLREDYVQRVKEYEDNLKSMSENDVKHFRAEGGGPLSDITEQGRSPISPSRSATSIIGISRPMRP